MRTLVAGWFSFVGMGATAGDLICRDLVTGWLAGAGHPFDVALAEPFLGGVDWRAVDPSEYSQVVFVCGPFGNGKPVAAFLDRFASARFVGLNLSMLQDLQEWNPFELLLERDSSRRSHPDLVFLGPAPGVPVVGLVLIDAQPEYAERDLHVRANGSLRGLLERRSAAVVEIDTRLDVPNRSGSRSPGEVEALISRMDVVLTTRLHGMVLALKNGVPALVIDPVAGGEKVSRQARTIGWPTLFDAVTVTDDDLDRAFDACLQAEARRRAAACAAAARTTLEGLRTEFQAFLGSVGTRR